MLIINIKNVEKLIFYNKNLCQQLVDLNKFFQKWKFCIKHGQGVKQVLLDFLTVLSNEHIKILENHFQDQIQVDNPDYHIVKSFKFLISRAEMDLCGVIGYDNFIITRDEHHLYISFWR